MRWCIVGPGVSSFNGKSHVFSQKKQVEIAGEGKGLWVAGDRARPLESKATFGGLGWGGGDGSPHPQFCFEALPGEVADCGAGIWVWKKQGAVLESARRKVSGGLAGVLCAWSTCVTQPQFLFSAKWR